ASNAFPGLFKPVKYQGRHLVDGGIINNFPVDIIRTLTARPVLAIDVRNPLKTDLGLDAEPDAPTLLERVGGLLGRDDGRSGGNGGQTIDILMQAYKITQDRLIKVISAMHPPDVVLTPELPEEIGTQNFDRVEEAVRIGYESARVAIAT